MRTKTTRCYIEEYTNEAGALSARLREKLTGRKIDLGIADAEARTHFIQFLSAAKQNQADFPDYFEKDAEESIVVAPVPRQEGRARPWYGQSSTISSAV